MTFRSILRAAVAVVVAAGVGIAAPTAARATASDPEATTVWTPAPDGGDRSLPVPVAASETFTLDIDAMTRALVPAVSRRTTGVDGGADAVISVPTPTGELVRFAVTPVEVLADRLQQANPQIRTFAGRGMDDVGLTIRADITPLGFHAMIRSADGRTKAWFVDPATVGDDSRYVSYAAGASELPRLQEPEQGTIEQGPESPPTADIGDGETTVALRTVRLALANDPAFASFYGTDNVLPAKVSIVNRVAGVFNDDLGVRLVLSEGTDRLNFDTDAAATQPGGACGPDACFTPEALRGCEVETLRQNSAAVAGIVGNDAYDVGHIVLGGGGGGIAGYGEVGLDFVKGGGCTGSATPVGDAFAIDYVAHEIGHQLGASHTFNACGGSSGATAVEPGSGSTIMAYAGLCGANDLQTHSDPYLSHASIDEIHRTLDQRLPAVDTANTAPTVTAPASRTIPIRTPFALTAEATDAEGPVFLLWEQGDVGDGDRALLDDTKTAGPLFRVFGVRADISEADARTYFSPGRNLASADATRTFPDLTQILRGNTNADTGVCGATLTPAERVDCASEFLPTAAYGGTGPASLNFRVTARDADSRGGGVTGAQVRLDVDRTAGPLLVSGLEDTDGRYVVNSRHTLRWVVNGTGREGLAPRVRVVMSTGFGERFDRVLLEDTPNDGSAAITLPGTPAADVRFRVEAIDNYFFAIGPDPIEIVASLTPEPTPEPTREPDPTATPGTTPGPVPSPPAPDGRESAPSAGPPNPGAPPVVDAAAHRDSASLARTGGPDGVLAALMGAGAVLLGVAVRGVVRRTRRTVSPIAKEGKAS